MSCRQPPPSADEQLVFLSTLQRLFAEGDFAATYKYALLMALADLAVESGRDDGDSLHLSNHQIAERFIQLYWGHTVPYGGTNGEDVGVLCQNNGTQAAVISGIVDFRLRQGVNTHAQARRQATYPALVKKVANTVSAQPLKYMQNLGGGTEMFLYTRHSGGISLLPGVSYCLRRFYPLIQQLCRHHWIDHIKRNKRNATLIGADDLESFLFETPRQSLVVIAKGLKKIEGERCFYCGHRLSSEVDVDHYIPFSLYPRDLAHNFVLSHPSCNRSKSATLAGKDHLARWIRRLEQHNDALSELGMEAGASTDAYTCLQVAAWGYNGAYETRSHAWISANRYELVTTDFISLLR